MADLTQKQIECLRDAARKSGISSWDYGSTTINVLRHLGFLANGAGSLFITESGRNELARLSMLEARRG